MVSLVEESGLIGGDAVDRLYGLLIVVSAIADELAALGRVFYPPLRQVAGEARGQHRLLALTQEYAGVLVDQGAEEPELAKIHGAGNRFGRGPRQRSFSPSPSLPAQPRE
jgi:hypothetical protein